MGLEFTPDIDLIAFEFLDMPVITFLAEEGALTVEEKRVEQSGATAKVHGFALEIQKGDPVVVVTTEDLTVKQRVAAGGAQQIVGFATGPSTPLEGIEMPELQVVAVTGDPELLQVTVEVMALMLRKILLATGATTVAAGDSVKLHATEIATWDKGTANNGTLALTGGAAEEEIAVLFNHFGVFS